MHGDRMFSRMALFWNAILAALLALSTVQAATDDPGMMHGWNGVLTVALAFSYGLWFFFLITLRVGRRRGEQVEGSRTRLYTLLALGLALTLGLVLLHGEYVGLIFAGMGIAVFALDGWITLIPVVFLGALFLYTTDSFQSGAVSRMGESLLSLVSTAGLIYTLAAVIRQRVERDQLIAELREAHDELRLSHARDVELAALRERNRLAREMHDSLGHALVLIAIKIEAAQRLQAVDPERAAAEWEATKALVRATMSDLRSSLAGLRLPVLDEQPFRSALADLGSDLQVHAGVAVSSEIPPEVDQLDRNVQETLYRVAQEGLANVARHAHAENAWIRLTVSAGTAELVIEDDGTGLDAASVSGAHFGVIGMRERVEALGGTFALQPRPGGGARLRAAVPVREEADVRYPHAIG